jgi:hypothetical protein
MKRFVEGADRGQSTLLPECLDDWIDEENPVRATELFGKLKCSQCGCREVLALPQTNRQMRQGRER